MQATNTNHHDDQSHPLPNGGREDEQGGGNLRQGLGLMGDGGGQANQAASGVTSVTDSPTVIGDGGEENAAGAWLEQFSFETAHDIHDIPVLEGVDEDADGTEATMLDDLLVLAGDGNPIWVKELRKYLQREEKEREEMQEERAARLALWQESITGQPT
jgi:hypothetical protein